jgi:hypothetical protein
MAFLHVGDIGTLLEYDVIEDGEPMPIGTADVLQLLLHKPDGTVLARDAALVTPGGEDGAMGYRTVAGDLDLAGSWQIQPYLEIDGWKGHGQAKPFLVAPSLTVV